MECEPCGDGATADAGGEGQQAQPQAHHPTLHTAHHRLHHRTQDVERWRNRVTQFREEDDQVLQQDPRGGEYCQQKAEKVGKFQHKLSNESTMKFGPKWESRAAEVIQLAH